MASSLPVEGLHVVHAAPHRPNPARPPLLLVHGATDGAWVWDNWRSVLPGRAWEAFALSLRNHPGSYPVDERTCCAHL